jgi:hypothetical protein
MKTEHFVNLANEKIYKVKSIGKTLGVSYIQNSKHMLRSGYAIKGKVLDRIEALLWDYIGHIDDFLDDKIKPSELFTLVPFNKIYFKQVSYVNKLPNREMTSQYTIGVLKSHLRDVKETTMLHISPIKDIKYRVNQENVTTSL